VTGYLNTRFRSIITFETKEGESMPNVAKVLREEIARISRKETKSALGRVHKPTVWLRRTVADLKRRLALMEKESKRLAVLLTKAGTAGPEGSESQESKRVRITAKGMRSLRRKLGLTQKEFAQLTGVSVPLVSVWEKKAGALRVRDRTRALILSIRDLGAREARERLTSFATKQRPKRTKKPAPQRRKGRS
jgi:DNA-binding transcriptional regulator YiaG